MNNRQIQRWLKGNSNLVNHLVIAIIFLTLLAVFLWSLDRYWQKTLQPRLYLAAKTQASILAQSQGTVLLGTLEHSNALAEDLMNTIRQMLIVEDPAIGGRYIHHFSLELNYDAIGAPAGSLDYSTEGTPCPDCFRVDIPLISHMGELMGVAMFDISDAYFRSLSAEMKSKLYAESSIALGLLVAVWLALAIMFQRLNSAKLLIEASDQAKTKFMANVTHELRTPLNAILGYTQLYKQNSTLMQEHSHGIETIDRSAEHLLLLINDILEFSRTDEDSLTIHPHEVNLPLLLRTLVDMISISAEVKNLTFTHVFSADLPDMVLVDDKRLRQVLLNLLHNAVKFTHSGQINFSVTHLKQSRDHRHKVRFSVKDTGIGIAKEQLQHIFIPFQQLDNDITRAEGSGLGLTISQRLVRLMGAELEVRSVPEQGSEFWFELELRSIANAAEMENAPEPSQINTPLVLPSQDILQQLQLLARQHNVLGIRELVKDLELQHEYQAFVQKIQPFIRQYRFKQLVVWLNQLPSDDR
ncbi:sensor histidine kinase [Bowmanella denitrificans]|uniref:sensor histidine kinase n=1 Tax=Bowmanella denitrificans TaxID=366582 RepID=UPI000C9C7DB8|nr:ATP-binding protein [Bowmanella denitrificans]